MKNKQDPWLLSLYVEVINFLYKVIPTENVVANMLALLGAFLVSIAVGMVILFVIR